MNPEMKKLIDELMSLKQQKQSPKIPLRPEQPQPNRFREDFLRQMEESGQMPSMEELGVPRERSTSGLPALRMDELKETSTRPVTRMENRWVQNMDGEDIFEDVPVTEQQTVYPEYDKPQPNDAHVQEYYKQMEQPTPELSSGVEDLSGPIGEGVVESGQTSQQNFDKGRIGTDGGMTQSEYDTEYGGDKGMTKAESLGVAGAGKALAALAGGTTGGSKEPEIKVDTESLAKMAGEAGKKSSSSLDELRKRMMLTGRMI